jgi:predicted enzyme related to lactoylglutathione lyase
MFTHVRALAVHVTDLERAKRFYTEVLGFELRVQVSPTLCFLNTRAPGINVYLEGGHRPSTVDRETARLGFFLQLDGPVHAAYDRLKERGVEMLTDAPEEVGDDVWTFPFADPDGNILEATGSA